MKNLLIVLATAFLLALAAGCGDSTASEDFCDRVYAAGCEYSGGKDECVSSFADVEEVSAARGCSAQHNSFLDCAAGVFETSCNSTFEDVSTACPSEEAALRACDESK